MRIFRMVLLLFVMIALLLPASANNSTGVFITKSTLPVPIAEVSSGSGSSGNSGNGEVASDEPFPNIARSEKRWQDLKAGYVATYLFNLNIYKVEVMPLNNEFGVSMKIEELFNRSNSTTGSYDGSGEIYKYFNINIGSRRISNATIYFTIPTSDNAELLRWNTTKLVWDNLKTTKIDNTHYRANITGFSNFAIVIFKTPEPTKITTPQPIITTKTPELPHTNIDENETNPSPSTAPPSNNGVIIIGVLIIIILIYFIFIY